jgi:hypothetical protein
VELPVPKPEELPANWQELPGPQRAEIMKRLEAAGAAPKGPTVSAGVPQLRASLQSSIAMIEALQKAYPEGIRAGDVFELRTEFGTAGSRGNAWKKLPGQPKTAAATAAKDAQEALSDTLHRSLPDLDMADMTYSRWRSVGDALKAAALKEEGRAVSPVAIMATRQGIAGLLAQLPQFKKSGPLPSMG